MILPALFIGPTRNMGKGVFTAEDLEADTIIEISPVVVMSHEDRQLIDQTLLHDYIFEWGENIRQCCMALGYISMYNHSYTSNCEYDMDYDEETMTIRTVSPVKAGTELYINYNGDWNNGKKVWFETIDN